MTESSGRRRRIALVAIGALALVALVAVFWVGARTLAARGELESAAGYAASARGHLTEGRTERAVEDVDEFIAHARTATQLTSDPVSIAARYTPLVGPNLLAFGQVAQSVDIVASDALDPLVSALGVFADDSFAMTDGRIDLEPIQAVAPTLRESEAIVRSASADVAAIDTSATIPPVTDAVERLRVLLDETSAALTTASRTAQLLPAMLGGDGERDYLILFQNNSEVRASGGLPGALALVTTSDGAFELTDQRAANDFPRYPEPVLPLDYATESLYGGTTGRYMQNVGLTPDFPTTAAIASEMWKRETGTEVDGVIAVDPVLLGYLLAATGPVSLTSGDVLDAGNAVDFLLSDVYAKYPDNALQDAIFADATRGVIAALGSGDIDVPKVLEGLARGTSEGRLSIWNSRPDEQALLTDTELAGTLPESNSTKTALGVFFDDATGAKMDYYLDAESRVVFDGCRVDEPAWSATVSLASSAPADAGTSLPAYVTGDGFFGVPPGTIRTRVIVYGPVGSTVRSVVRDGSEIEAQVEQHLGRAAAQIVVDLVPGESAELTVDFSGASAPLGPTSVRMTPLIDFTAPRISSRSCA